MPRSDPLLSPESAAAYMDVSRATIYRYFDEGLRSIRIGGSRRIRTSALEAFIQKKAAK